MDSKVNGEKPKKFQVDDDDDDDFCTDLDDDHKCGLGSWKPDWMQVFASKNAYVVAYCALSLTQGMFYTYLVSVLTTIEKRFAISSKVTGIIMSGNEVSEVLGAFFVAYYGGQSHRPRWIAAGMYLSSLSCFLMALPEFVIPSNEFLSSSNIWNNATSSYGLCRNDSYIEECKNQRSGNHSSAAIATLYFGLFVSGIGTTALHTLGFPYMDDNVAKKKIPVLLGVSFALRVIGPALGFLLGGSVLRIYHDLNVVPDITFQDPRWIGAWWLGFVVIGVCIAVTAFFMLMFPKELPSRKNLKVSLLDLTANSPPIKKSTIQTKGLPPIKELPTALKRLAKNPIVLAHTAESIFYLLGVVGFAFFFPKYIETQFGQSASGANFITGASSIAVMMFGYVISGFIVQKFQPRPRFLSGYCVFVGLLQIFSLVIGMFIKCEDSFAIQGTLTDTGSLDLSSSCNEYCACTTSRFSPVCDNVNNVTYFSACHLGCTDFNRTSKQYLGCSCQDSSSFDISEIIATVTKGKCSFLCEAFMMYIILKTVTRLIGSTERVGTSIILFRSVDERDKSLTMAWYSVFLCLFAFMPCPILYGAIIDKTCLVWEETCGERGNCWVYDSDQMRVWLHGFTASLLIISNLFQLIVWYYCKDLHLYQDLKKEVEMLPVQSPEEEPFTKGSGD